MRCISLFLLIASAAASAESPFLLTSSKRTRIQDGVPVLDEPGSAAARDRAVEDLLGIRHFLIFLKPDHVLGERYQLKLVQQEESGAEKVLEQVDIRNSDDPRGGVGVSVLPSDLSVRIKIYTSSNETMHEVASKKSGKIEIGNADNGVLLRYIVDDKPLLKLLWGKDDK